MEMPNAGSESISFSVRLYAAFCAFGEPLPPPRFDELPAPPPDGDDVALVGRLGRDCAVYSESLPASQRNQFMDT